MIASKGLQLMRNFSTTAVRNSHAYGGPGSNLPFDVYSKYKFTALLAVFFSTGFGLPFLMVRFVKHRSL
ncbi:cytochrome c oxidase subunit 7C, mitochondrial-like [Melanaphis sacchari]|uniref:cytochrome c oxidase subunit 7C, mitochondrial-like n=1 Tax=Melanaphis sacchari TaxID=742174 RepID=UPI000DC1398D|nr:cytochrome c oxidase subunit 7C, mitochondrial-like [Melanaphis sacchari]